jgi:predicted DNA-binding transcriptional regulator YafY
MARAHVVSVAERLDALVAALRDRPGVTASTLAEEFGVSPRSLFRDIERLRDRGYPIEADRGRGGGLRLRGNWGLGRVLLGREEALCTLLGLAIAQQMAMPMFAPEVHRARKKIAEAFPPAERRRIAPLRERLFVGEAASRSVRESLGALSGPAMRVLQSAFVEERAVDIEYAKPGERSVVRTIEPHVMVINWPAWYVLGHDELRDERRTFRLDRIVAARVGTRHFRPRPAEMVRELVECGVALGRV